MKNISLSVLTIFVWISVVAQISTIPTTSHIFNPSSILSLPKEGFISLKKSPTNQNAIGFNKHKSAISLVKYDKDMRLVQEVKFANGEFVFNSYYSEVLQLGDKFWFLYLDPAEKNNIGNIKAAEINLNTLQISSPKTLVSSNTLNQKTISTRWFDDFVTIKTVTSPTGNYISILVATEINTFYIACFDAQLNPVWEKTETLSNANIRNEASIAVDDEGTLYLGYINKSGGQVTYYTKKTSNTVMLDLAGSSPKHLKILSTRNTGSIAISGTYSDNDFSCAGAYLSSLNIASHKLSPTIKTAFPDNMVKLLDKEGFATTKAKKYGVFPHLNMDLLEPQNGKVDLVIEPAFENYGQKISSTRFGSIITVRFTESSSSFVRLPKYNFTNAAPERMFYTAANNNKTYVFYFDDASNLEKDINLEADVAKRAVLVVGIIEPDGTVTRKQVNDTYLGESESIRLFQQRQIRNSGN